MILACFGIIRGAKMKLSTYLMYDISGNNIGTLFKITILRILANGKLLICQYKRKEY